MDFFCNLKDSCHEYKLLILVRKKRCWNFWDITRNRMIKMHLSWTWYLERYIKKFESLILKGLDITINNEFLGKFS